MSNGKREQLVQDVTATLGTSIKNKLFDIIATGLLIAILMLNLGVLELRDVTFEGIITILLEAIPLFITSVLLSSNYYNKGTFIGKNTEKFKNTVTAYSGIVVDLSGAQLDALTDFCNKYNDDTLKNMQTNILKKASISYERFNDCTVDENDVKLEPLKVLTNKQIKTMFNKERAAIIIKAKKLHIAGLSSNILLGNVGSHDDTNLGKNEGELRAENTVKSASSYILWVLIMSLIGIKDILQWGWAGLLIVCFKLLFVICAALMKQFIGYDDVTVRLVNHIARKTDILKQFNNWYELNYIVMKESDNNLPIGNNQ